MCRWSVSLVLCFSLLMYWNYGMVYAQPEIPTGNVQNITLLVQTTLFVLSWQPIPLSHRQSFNISRLELESYPNSFLMPIPYDAETNTPH